MHAVLLGAAESTASMRAVAESLCIGEMEKRGWEGVGAVFTVKETLEGKMDITTGFPNVENGAGEVLVVVAKL